MLLSLHDPVRSPECSWSPCIHVGVQCVPVSRGTDEASACWAWIAPSVIKALAMLYCLRRRIVLRFASGDVSFSVEVSILLVLH